MRKSNLFATIIALMTFCFLLQPRILPAEESSLDDLYRIALASSETIKLAQENLTIATLGKDKARALLVPKLTAFGSFTQYSESKYSEGFDLGFGLVLPGSLLQADHAANWGLRLNQTFSVSARELLAYRIAGENITRSTKDLNAVREEYLFAVATAYFDVLRVRKNLEIADANLERLTAYRSAAEKRLKVGEVTKTVLLRADAELSGARSDRLEAANGTELAMAVFTRLVGIKESFVLREERPPEEELPSLPLLQNKAFSERSDLMSLDIAKTVAGEQVHFTRGTYWPNLSIFGVYNRWDQQPVPSAFNRESIYGGVSLNFPFFEGGLRIAEVKEARAKERQTGYLYDDLRKSIGIEVEGAYLDALTQKGALKFLNDQIIFARDNYRAVVRQFELGLASSLDVMDANTLLVSAERTAAGAYYNYQLSRLRLQKATGVFLKGIMGARS